MQTRVKKVSIITVNFNQPQATLQLLRSVLLNCSSGDVEIIVVDNGSDVDPINRFSAEMPDVIYIRSEKNLGFAGGNNLGIKKASGDYLFFVNNDTEFTSGLVEKLSAVLEQNLRVGIVCPMIKYYYQPDIIQYAGYTEMNFFTGRNKCIGQFEIDKGQYDKSAYLTSYAHGAAMMVRRESIDKAGTIPEDYFLYYEEMDWCEKLKSAGFEIWVEPLAVIYHKESLSIGSKTPLKEYFMTRNRILFIKRNASLSQSTVFYLYLFFVLIPKKVLEHLLCSRLNLIVPFFKGVWDSIIVSKLNINT